MTGFLGTSRSTSLGAVAVAAIVATSIGCPAVDVLVGKEEGGAQDVGAQETGAQDAGAQDAAVERATTPEAAPDEEGGPQTCSTTADCETPAYCAKSKCDAREGIRTLPSQLGDCPNTEQEVCGCDGVLYWNDCLRQRDGVSFAANGECTTQYRQCGGPSDAGCPVPDAVCARVDSAGGPGYCQEFGRGLCWVLPDICPVDTSGTLWASCLPSEPSCTDLCNAARSQQPYVRLSPISPTCH